MDSAAARAEREASSWDGGRRQRHHALPRCGPAARNAPQIEGDRPRPANSRPCRASERTTCGGSVPGARQRRRPSSPAAQQPGLTSVPLSPPPRLPCTTTFSFAAAEGGVVSGARRSATLTRAAGAPWRRCCRRGRAEVRPFCVPLAVPGRERDVPAAVSRRRRVQLRSQPAAALPRTGALGVRRIVVAQKVPGQGDLDGLHSGQKRATQPAMKMRAPTAALRACLKEYVRLHRGMGDWRRWSGGAGRLHWGVSLTIAGLSCAER